MAEIALNMISDDACTQSRAAIVKVMTFFVAF